MKEARELQIAPSLLAGVLITENARLEPETVSNRGAVGLMQVMRFHAGVFDCDSDDLLQVEANICHGSRVFAGYLKRTKDVRSALLTLQRLHPEQGDAELPPLSRQGASRSGGRSAAVASLSASPGAQGSVHTGDPDPVAPHDQSPSRIRSNTLPILRPNSSS